jgi:hypothetical protein
MATANLILIKDEQTARKRARAAIEAYSPKSDQQRIRLEPIPVRKGRHLDVDEVLAHSFARVVGE